MADQERQRSRSSRPRHPSERSIEADAQRREQLGSLCDAALHEADALLVTLRELQLISKSSRPDRRTIAFAVASLRGELPAERSAQAAHFGLHVDSLRRARADWVDDEDERLRQAMAYRALTPDEVHTPPPPCPCPRPRPCTRPLPHVAYGRSLTDPDYHNRRRINRGLNTHGCGAIVAIPMHARHVVSLPMVPMDAS